MKYQVPQFIETETKIVGPFTLKQFIYIAAGVALIFMLNYILSSFFLFIVCAVLILGISLALAFLKVDDIPLPKYILLMFSFSLGSKKYEFKKELEDPSQVHAQTSTDN